MWVVLPREDLWITVFADGIALALHNVFRDLRAIRRFMVVVSAGMGLALNAENQRCDQLHSEFTLACPRRRL